MWGKQYPPETIRYIIVVKWKQQIYTYRLIEKKKPLSLKKRKNEKEGNKV